MARASALSPTVSPGPPEEFIPLFIASAIIFAIGFGIGNGLSNITGGTLSYATKGPYQPSASDDEEVSPSTDKYGQLSEE